MLEGELAQMSAMVRGMQQQMEELRASRPESTRLSGTDRSSLGEPQTFTNTMSTPLRPSHRAQMPLGQTIATGSPTGNVNIPGEALSQTLLNTDSVNGQTTMSSQTRDKPKAPIDISQSLPALPSVLSYTATPETFVTWRQSLLGKVLMSSLPNPSDGDDKTKPQCMSHHNSTKTD